MRGSDGAVGRTVTVVALLCLIAVALRGYLPDHPARPVHARPMGPTASLVVTTALLAVAIAVIGVAIIARLRQPRSGSVPTTGRPDWFRRGGGAGRASWRMVLIGIGVFLAGLAVAVVLAQLLAARHGVQLAGPHPSQTATGQPGHPGQSPPPDPGGDAGLTAYLSAGTALLLAVLAAATVAANRTGRRLGAAADTDLPDQPRRASAPPESLARAAARGLAEITDASREPRKAIIACYRVMESELATVPEAAPQDFDTAAEVLARAVDHHALPAGSATVLVELFTEARFSRHVMTEDHRHAAVRALEDVLGELRAAS